MLLWLSSLALAQDHIRMELAQVPVRLVAERVAGLRGVALVDGCTSSSTLVDVQTDTPMTLQKLVVAIQPTLRAAGCDLHAGGSTVRLTDKGPEPPADPGPLVLFKPKPVPVQAAIPASGCGLAEVLGDGGRLGPQARVMGLRAGSTAATIGLRNGDAPVRINNTRITTWAQPIPSQSGACVWELDRRGEAVTLSFDIR